MNVYASFCANLSAEKKAELDSAGLVCPEISIVIS